MVIQARQCLVVKLCPNQNGTENCYKTSFVVDLKKMKGKITYTGEGDFSATLPYNNRNVELFSNIDEIPTFFLINFDIDEPWDVGAESKTPTPMPFRIETYNEEHDLLEDEHRITISGRTAFSALLDSRVIHPRLVYQYESVEDGYFPWILAGDLFSRNVNADKKQDIIDAVGINPIYYMQHTDARYVPHVSLTHQVVPHAQDPKFQIAYLGNNLLETIKGLVARGRTYIQGVVRLVDNEFHMDYIIKKFEDLRLGHTTETPLLYDYGAMPPRNYNKLLSIEENRDMTYAKIAHELGESSGNPATYEVYKRNAQAVAKSRGWNRKEMFYDGESLPLSDLSYDKQVLMLKMAAADELYADGNMLTDIEDIEYHYSPLKFYENCWPGCVFSSFGPSGKETDLLITGLVITSSETEGWVVTPELSRYKDIYEEENNG